ncbi:hypothetical protein Tco_0313242 [Tanacetum coccineum]
MERSKSQGTVVSLKWTKAKISSDRMKGKQVYGFRLWASWMDHYGRLWEYMQAILDTNPGSTCILDEEETEHGITILLIPSDWFPILRIYHKNGGSSEMIFNQKMKKRRFIPNGEGSTTDKAFSL